MTQAQTPMTPHTVSDVISSPPPPTDDITIRARGKGIGLILACLTLGLGGGVLGTAVTTKNDLPTDTTVTEVLDVMKESVVVANKLIVQNEKFTYEISTQNAALVNEVKHINENLGNIADKVDAQNLSLMKDREAISGIKEKVNGLEKRVDRMIDRFESFVMDSGD